MVAGFATPAQRLQSIASVLVSYQYLLTYQLLVKYGALMKPVSHLLVHIK